MRAPVCSRMSKLTRLEILEEMPWVEKLGARTSCDGYRWSKMPIEGARDETIREQFACRAFAYWRFTALPESGTKSGVYCFQHLMTLLINDDPLEDHRTRLFLNTERIQKIIKSDTFYVARVNKS